MTDFWPHLARASLALALASSACAGARADDLDAVYSIRLIGLPIGIGSVSAHFSGDAYSIEARGKLTGLANMVGHANGASTGKGMFVGQHISPRAYATTAVNSSTTRTIRMALAGNSATGVEIAPPFDEKPDRIPLSPADTRNIVDPVGAFAIRTASGAPDASVCQRTLPIFDGWTRFDIALSYAGVKDVSAKGYDGKAVVCSVRYTPISGHRRDRPATKFMQDNRDMEVWMAPVGATKVFMPFHISVRTMIGTVTVDATQFATK
jgi:Protein of unknown function (DUF3108)